MSGPTRAHFLAGLAGVPAALALAPSRPARAAGKLALDYAYYNPPSLVLKEKGWLEDALHAPVEWTLSLGSNKANQYLAAGSVAFGCTAGSAALVAIRGRSYHARFPRTPSRPPRPTDDNLRHRE